MTRSPSLKRLPVQALYTASSLASFTGISRERMIRLLELLWESIVLASELREEGARPENDTFEK